MVYWNMKVLQGNRNNLGIYKMYYIYNIIIKITFNYFNAVGIFHEMLNFKWNSTFTAILLF